MEKSLRPNECPVQSFSSTALLVIVGGFSLFWACFFAMLMRNSFLDVGIDQLWHHLALRIAFFIGFGGVSFAIARFAEGIPPQRFLLIATGFVALFSIIALVSSGTFALLGAAHPLAFDVAAWGFSGIGLGCLLFIWIPLFAPMEEIFASRIMAFSIICGGAVYLLINLLPPLFNTVLLALCPLISLIIQRTIASENQDTPHLDATCTCATQTNPQSTVKLSWSFGVIYIVYGIVFGLGAGSVTQIAGGTILFVGVAAFILIGATAALAFMKHFSGRMRQIDVLRMLFPFLVISLVTMSFFTGTLYTLSNLLLLAGYVFLVTVSVAFEVHTARTRQISPLFVVGMSQGALSAGMVAGFALGLLPAAEGSTDFAVLSAVALGLVVLLAVFVTFAPKREEGISEKDEAAHEESDHEQGRWKASCATVAREAKLTARETEVFFLMAKGRVIEHIQNKLYISSHTVKTHTYNIYKKMGIGSREELLDAIEAVNHEPEKE